MRAPIAITGVGCVTPIGVGREAFARGLRSGELGVRPAPWGTEGQLFAAVAPGFDPTTVLDDRILAGTDRYAQYALVASEEALSHAGLLASDVGLDPLRTAVVDGTSMGGFYSLMHAQHHLAQSRDGAVPSKTMLMIWANMAAAQIALRHGLHGPQRTISTACASALDALGTAADLLALGDADVALCGGSEGGALLPGASPGFVPATAVGGRLLGMETPERDRQLASVPFDVDRRGIVFGEGATWFVLETEAHAEQRGAAVIGWLLGHGSCADSYHPSSPEPSGRWEARAITLAIERADLNPGEVDVVYAHATGTPKGDRAEVEALRRVFGAEAGPAITAIKGNTGHTGAASGAMSVAAALEAVATGRVEPILGTRELDTDNDLDIVLAEPRELPVQVAVVDSFGFGGQNAAVVISGDDHEWSRR